MSVTTVTKVDYTPQSPIAIIVHCLLTFATFGSWIIPWIVIRLITRRPIHTTHDAAKLAQAETEVREQRNRNFGYATLFIGGPLLLIYFIGSSQKPVTPVQLTTGSISTPATAPTKAAAPVAPHVKAAPAVRTTAAAKTGPPIKKTYTPKQLNAMVAAGTPPATNEYKLIGSKPADFADCKVKVLNLTPITAAGPEYPAQTISNNSDVFIRITWASDAMVMLKCSASRRIAESWTASYK